MMDIFVWVIVGLVAVAAIIAAIWLIVKLVKLPTEERKELIVNFLVGLVTAAEAAYTDSGMGAQKLQDVENAFNKNAPWFLKLVLTLTKTANLQELIEVALQRAKTIWGK